MKAPLRRYLPRVAILTGVVLLALPALFLLLPGEWTTPWMYLLPPLAALFSLLSFSIHANSSGQNTGSFTRTSMLLTMARLFFYVTIALLMLLLLPEQGIALVLSWMVLYLLFVTLEASEMARLVRQTPPTDKGLPL